MHLHKYAYTFGGRIQKPKHTHTHTHIHKHSVGVCVDDGWFKQPHLARGRRIELWGWVSLHNCCTVSDQVEPAITAHTQEMSNVHGNMDHQVIGSVVNKLLQ